MTYRGWCPEVARNSREGARSWETLGRCSVTGKPGVWTPGLSLLLGLGRPRPYPAGVTETCQGDLTPSPAWRGGLGHGKKLHLFFSPGPKIDVGRNNWWPGLALL